MITKLLAWLFLLLQEALQGQRTWLAALVLGFVTLMSYFIAASYTKKGDHPDGPTPLPIIGNILVFRHKGHVHDKLIELSKRFGNVLTLWMGSKAHVFITQLEPALEAFRERNVEFAGRPSLALAKLVTGNKGKGVFLTDYGRDWEVLRRVAYSAVRKYTFSEHLPHLVAETVDEVMAVIKSTHGDEPFDIKDYIYLMTYNILAESAYGKKYSIDDRDFHMLMNDNKIQFKCHTELMIVEFLPFLKPFYRRSFNIVVEAATRLREYLSEQFYEHLETYKSGQIRDFCDALIAAKVEAELEQRDSSFHLRDENLALTLMDLFLAGTDTTRFTFHWMILFIANYPDVQKRLRQELEVVLGDRIATQEHCARLHYAQAFISESLRYRPVAPLGVPHKATVDSHIGGKSVKKDTTVSMVNFAILNDPKYWEKPDEFRPERFLDSDGRHSSKMPSFVPFGMGRRICPGKKLAVIDLCMMLARFLQATSGHAVELPGGPGSVDMTGDDSIATGLISFDYDIVIKESR